MKRLPPSPSRDGSSEEDDEFHSNVKINFLSSHHQDNIVPSIISYAEGQSVSGSDLDTPTYPLGMKRAGNDCSSMNSLSDKDASKKSLKMPSNENFFKLIANYNGNRKDSGKSHKSNKLSSSNSDDNCTKSKTLMNMSITNPTQMS